MVYPVTVTAIPLATLVETRVATGVLPNVTSSPVSMPTSVAVPDKVVRSVPL